MGGVSARQADQSAWAEAQLEGKKAAKSKAKGFRSFGAAPCEVGRKRGRPVPEWQRKVRACFGLDSRLALATSSGRPAGPSPVPSAQSSLAITLAPLDAAAAPVLCLQQKIVRRKRDDAAHDAALQAWASERSMDVLPSVSISKGMRLPLHGYDCSVVVPPFVEIGKRVLNAVQCDKHGNAGRAGVRLQEAWDKRKATLLHAEAPEFCTPPEGVSSLWAVSKCYEAGFCVCKGAPELQKP